MTKEDCDRLGITSKDNLHSAIILISCIVGAVAIVLFSSCNVTPARADIQETASYYSVKSCLREGTSGIMANGEKLDDNEDTCASWDYAFGTMLRVTNIKNNKVVYVIVKDRGPAKRLYRKGRVIDLSVNAFKQIASLKEGIISVKVEAVRFPMDKNGELITNG